MAPDTATRHVSTLFGKRRAVLLVRSTGGDDEAGGDDESDGMGSPGGGARVHAAGGRVHLLGGLGLVGQPADGVGSVPCVGGARSEEHTSELQSRENLV